MSWYAYSNIGSSNLFSAGLFLPQNIWPYYASNASELLDNTFAVNAHEPFLEIPVKASDITDEMSPN
jgi:hypothetical protein